MNLLARPRKPVRGWALELPPESVDSYLPQDIAMIADLGPLGRLPCEVLAGSWRHQKCLCWQLSKCQIVIYKTRNGRIKGALCPTTAATDPWLWRAPLSASIANFCCTINTVVCFCPFLKNHLLQPLQRQDRLNTIRHDTHAATIYFKLLSQPT